MIKSNGGVFGRNPKFNNVTVEGDLVSTGGMTVTPNANAPTSNIAIGPSAGAAMDATTDDSIAIGRNAYLLGSGDGAVVIGATAGDAITNAPRTTLVGFAAGTAITTGSGNTCVGSSAGAAIQGASGNTAIGDEALFSGNSNGSTALGQFAARSVTSATRMTAVGYQALQLSASASEATAIGGQALERTSPATNSVALGSRAGLLSGASPSTSYNTSATSCIYIGYQSRASASGNTNEVVIGGVDACGDGSNTTVIGNTSTTSTRIPAGNLTLTNGNLILGTAGNGISFAADPHAAGMTSELLDDYEEGTWTPVYGPSGGTFAAITMDVISAVYTKIGRQVTVLCFIRTDNLDTTGALGSVLINGLPFTIASGTESVGCVAMANNWAGENPLSARLQSNTSYMQLLYRAAVDGIDQGTAIADMTAGLTANQNQISISATYFTT